MPNDGCSLDDSWYLTLCIISLFERAYCSLTHQIRSYKSEAIPPLSGPNIMSHEICTQPCFVYSLVICMIHIPILPRVGSTALKQLRGWRHQMEAFHALLAICAGNSPVPGDQRPVTRSFDVFFDLRLNKRLSKQSWGWWFETPSRPVWHHCSGTWSYHIYC